MSEIDPSLFFEPVSCKLKQGFVWGVIRSRVDLTLGRSRVSGAPVELVPCQGWDPLDPGAKFFGATFSETKLDFLWSYFLDSKIFCKRQQNVKSLTRLLTAN